MTVKLSKHHKCILDKLPMPIWQFNQLHWKTKDHLIDNMLVRFNREEGVIQRCEPRTITVYLEPFTLTVSSDATDDDIQNILDERGCGSAGWKEGNQTH